MALLYGPSFGRCGPPMVHSGQPMVHSGQPMVHSGQQMVHNQMQHVSNGMQVPMGMARGVPAAMYAELDAMHQQALNASNFYGANPHHMQNGNYPQHPMKCESEMPPPPAAAAQAPAQQAVGTNLSMEAPHVPQESSALGSVKVTPPHSNMSSMQFSEGLPLESFEYGANKSPDVDMIPFDHEVPFMREPDSFSVCNPFGSPNLLSGPNLMSVSNSGMMDSDIDGNSGGHQEFSDI